MDPSATSAFSEYLLQMMVEACIKQGPPREPMAWTKPVEIKIGPDGRATVSCGEWVCHRAKSQ